MSSSASAVLADDDLDWHGVHSTKVAALPSAIRNVAIVAHVDHGKTTLVDKLLSSAEGDAALALATDRLMDSGDLERERGITITSKVTRLKWKGTVINVVDTPGHADFGGEVERILSMVDGVVLVCDATEGPMAQTKFVLGKALSAGLAPVAVINKSDRPTNRIASGEVETELFDLFDALGATDEQLDYPTLFASAMQGWVTDDGDAAVSGSVAAESGMAPLLDMLVDHIRPPPSKLEDLEREPFALAVNNVGADPFLGRLATGRIHSGIVSGGDLMRVLNREGSVRANKEADSKVQGIFVTRGAQRVPLGEGVSAGAGDIVTLAGVDCDVGDTITARDGGLEVPLDTLPVAPPTLSMTIEGNTSPLAGNERKTIVAAGRVKERLLWETDNNVTLQVRPEGERCEVLARGELQLGILIEEMRREGFELLISPPKVLVDSDGREPFEEVTVDVETTHAGTVVNALTGSRRGILVDQVMLDDGGAGSAAEGRTRLTFEIPSRGLLGFSSEIATATRGSAVVNHLFLEMRDHAGMLGDGMRRGKIVCTDTGPATSYALDMISDRGTLFVAPGDEVYSGMVVGQNAKPGDLAVNACKAKAASNMRTVLKDNKTVIAPPVKRTVEEYIAYMDDDEQLEVTPGHIRLRKAELDKGKRDRAARDRKNAKKAR